MSIKKKERKGQILYDITYMWNLKYNTNESICETETGSQTQRLVVVTGKERGGGLGVWG